MPPELAPKSLLPIVGFCIATELASASTITFDAEGFNGPMYFAQASPRPQVISIAVAEGIATFTGGVILTNASNAPADHTSIYGTASIVSGLQNPISISFSQPINYLSFNLYNGNTSTTTYRIVDNKGNATTATLSPNFSSGQSLVQFVGGGTNFTVTSAVGGALAYDFAIDNVRLDRFASSSSNQFDIIYNTTVSTSFTTQLSFTSSYFQQTNPDVATLQNIKDSDNKLLQQIEATSRVVTLTPSSVVNGPKEAVKGFAIDRATDQIDPRARPVVQTIQLLLDVVESSAVAFTEAFKIEVLTVLKGAEKYLSALANDPPDLNYKQINQKSTVDLDSKFARRFGAEFALADKSFASFVSGVEDYQLLLLSLERMQGSAFANDLEWFARQKAAAEGYLADTERSFADAAQGFNQLKLLLANLGLGLGLFDPSLLGDLQNLVKSGGLPTALTSDLIEAGFDLAFIKGIESDILAATAPDVSRGMSIDLAASMSDLSSSLAFSSLSGLASPVPEPSEYILLSSGLVAIFFIARLGRKKKLNAFKASKQH